MDASMEPPQSLRPTETAWSSLAKRLAPSSLSAYRWAWELWEGWCAAFGGTPLPASQEDLARFIDHGVADGFSLSTLRVFRSAVGAVHDAAGFVAPAGPDVRDAMARAEATVAPRVPEDRSLPSPLTAECLEAVARASGDRDPTALALMHTMRDALLRRGEVTRLRWQDITRAPDGSGFVTISARAGNRIELYVSPETMTALDAIREDAAPGAPVFSVASGDAMSAADISRRIAAAAHRAGLSGRWTSESPRLGMAADLDAAGARPWEIMAAGRWRSDGIVMRYLGGVPRPPARNDAVRQLAGQPGAYWPLWEATPSSGGTSGPSTGGMGEES